MCRNYHHVKAYSIYQIEPHPNSDSKMIIWQPTNLWDFLLCISFQQDIPFIKFIHPFHYQIHWSSHVTQSNWKTIHWWNHTATEWRPSENHQVCYHNSMTTREYTRQNIKSTLERGSFYFRPCPKCRLCQLKFTAQSQPGWKKACDSQIHYKRSSCFRQ